MADHARDMQEIIMFPSDPTFKSYVRKNCINNTRVTTKDIDRAKDIYGPSTNMLKVKYTRPKANSHQRTLRIPISPKILSEYKNFNLFMDIIYVSGLPFLITRSGNIDLRSIQRLTSRSMNVIAKGLEVVTNKHSRRGFNITDFHADL